METNGIVNSPSWDGLAAVALEPLKGGKTASRAAGTAIVLMVAETRKGKVCVETQAGNAVPEWAFSASAEPAEQTSSNAFHQETQAGSGQDEPGGVDAEAHQQRHANKTQPPCPTVD